MQTWDNKGGTAEALDDGGGAAEAQHGGGAAEAQHDMGEAQRRCGTTGGAVKA